MRRIKPTREEKVKFRGDAMNYLLKYHQLSLMSILSSVENPSANIIEADFTHFLRFSTGEAVTFLEVFPILGFPNLNKAAILAQTHIREQNKNDENAKTLTVKSNVQVRLVISAKIPPQMIRKKFPKTKDAWRLSTVTGTVVKTGQCRMLEYLRRYQCQKCGVEFEAEADVEQYYAFGIDRCKNPEVCGSQSFKAVAWEKDDETCYKDYQEIRIQENSRGARGGQVVPSSLTVSLEDDLVDCCQPGDVVTVTGIVIPRWRSLIPEQKTDIELLLKTNSITVRNQHQTGCVDITDNLKQEFANFWAKYKQNPIVGRNLLLQHFCPQLYELYIVKLAVALVLVGGTAVQTHSGTNLRGESHLLLVGDPGTGPNARTIYKLGKSQLLKFAHMICPRSVLTTGIGSTKAGLTCMASKESGEWQLEAGALVLADGGICCIDEFSCLSEADRTCIHEAMEQQTISVAKAGMVTKLRSRCAILASTNSKFGKYDVNQSLCLNTGLNSPLLSRFDLILVLTDTKNEGWDEQVSEYLLKKQAENLQQKEESTNEEQEWSLSRLKAYLAFVRQLLPGITDEAKQVLMGYFQIKRTAAETEQGRATNRLLESLVRLAQAHAKLMCRKMVTLQDAIAVVSLMECTMNDNSSTEPIDVLHSVFPKDPEEEYERQANIVLNELLDLGELVPQMKDYGELVFDEDQTDFTDIRESPEPKRVRSDFGTEDEAEMENEEELVQNQENRSNEISKPDVTKAKAQNFLERIQQFRCSQE